ncbi:MAG TPA: LacI family DNA-binding transcriptional regulator [Steroidobacteraceae bacterium]
MNLIRLRAMSAPKSPKLKQKLPGAQTRRARAAAADPKSAGIKEIAEAVGVSIGTVDRALHSRPGISEATRARIMKAAAALGYRPNLAARHLKLGRQPQISVHLPQQIASYFDAMRQGIQQAAAQLQPPLKVEFHSFPRMGQGEIESLQAVLDQSCDGIIIAPGAPTRIAPLIRQATQRGIPVICVATDAPDSDRLAVVSSDPFTSGAIVAELLSRMDKGSHQAAIITGDLATVDHSEKVRGFRSMMADLGSALTLAEVAEAHDDPREAYRQTCDLLARRPKLSSIYVSTSNSLPVIEALEERGRTREVSVIVTDLFPELVPLMRAGKVFATLYQRPLTQGRLAFEAMHRFIVEGIRPKPVQKLPPYIVLRSNLELFIENSPEFDPAAKKD